MEYFQAMLPGRTEEKWEAHSRTRPLLSVCLETCSTDKEVSKALDETKAQGKCQSRRTAFCQVCGKRPQNASKSPLAWTLCVQRQSLKPNSYGEMFGHGGDEMKTMPS